LLADRTRSHITFRLAGGLLQEALDDATLLILKRQEEIGLDLLTDGEQRRHHFISHVLAACDGIDTVNLGVKDNTAALCSNGACPV
jgi:5-methyltetrahydropteroyltriglutamate--homocysteine methyltransferase